jgi:hypothetical protein
MSHIVSIATEVRDAAALRAACRRLKLPEPVHKTVTLFSGEATGLAVELPHWQYPVVIDTASGEIRYDNFEGRWGEQKHLDALLQMYSVEKAKIEARRKGYVCAEQQLADGSIKLTVNVGGAA